MDLGRSLHGPLHPPKPGRGRSGELSLPASVVMRDPSSSDIESRREPRRSLRAGLGARGRDMPVEGSPSLQGTFTTSSSQVMPYRKPGSRWCRCSPALASLPYSVRDAAGLVEFVTGADEMSTVAVPHCRETPLSQTS